MSDVSEREVQGPARAILHSPACWAYGRRGEGHSVIHSQRERRSRCRRCQKTFSATTGTTRYRAHMSVGLVAQVVTLLAHGCPPQAIVAACGWDERTVAR
jgi:transposase-like protein